MGNGENAGNQHFLHFPECFLSLQKQISVFEPDLFCLLQQLSIWTSLKLSCVVKGYSKKSSVYSSVLFHITLNTQSSENENFLELPGKMKYCWKPVFSGFFSTMFYILSKTGIITSALICFQKISLRLV